MSRADEPQRSGTSQTPSWVVDADPFARAGALLARALESVLEEKDHVWLAIPGGSALEAVSEARRRVGEAWGRVRLTWVDERCVSLADAESNRGAAARLGLISSDPSPDDTSSPSLVLPLYEDGETPSEALMRVRAEWARDLSEGLDVVLLGMGGDGHVASLFPSRWTSTSEQVVHVADSPKPPPDRITLTRAALSTAAQVILVAAGESKREALRRLRSSDPELPAQGLRGLLIVTDIDLDP